MSSEDSVDIGRPSYLVSHDGENSIVTEQPSVTEVRYTRGVVLLLNQLTCSSGEV